MYWSLNIVFVIFVGNVVAKECNCGLLCRQFNGVTVDNNCYYIAAITEIHGEQFIVGSSEDETKALDTLTHYKLNNETLLISTKSSYRLKRYHKGCFSNNCTVTIYRSNCKCTLTVVDNMLSSFNHVYTNYAEIFWSIVTVIIVVSIICILKCFLC